MQKNLEDGLVEHIDHAEKKAQNYIAQQDRLQGEIQVLS